MSENQYPAGDGKATRFGFHFNVWIQWVVLVWALICYFKGHTSHALFWAIILLGTDVTVTGFAIRAILIARLPNQR